ncbi:hypothetical protein NDU88_000686 [Pleurodeles waltl]|uniref:Uncharacterized protein n=1 Tax=Pleurodeles waltl TaxID=8319 RepID=A0AAV7SX46_PLEWA|nr:hypothetical protein NDU88_000686 [Pleurodeles waltl]
MNPCRRTPSVHDSLQPHAQCTRLTAAARPVYTTHCSRTPSVHDSLQPHAQCTRLTAAARPVYTTHCSRTPSVHDSLQPHAQCTRLTAAARPVYTTHCSRMPSVHDSLQPHAQCTYLPAAFCCVNPKHYSRRAGRWGSTAKGDSERLGGSRAIAPGHPRDLRAGRDPLSTRAPGGRLDAGTATLSSLGASRPARPSAVNFEATAGEGALCPGQLLRASPHEEGGRLPSQGPPSRLRPPTAPTAAAFGPDRPLRMKDGETPTRVSEGTGGQSERWLKVIDRLSYERGRSFGGWAAPSFFRLVKIMIRPGTKGTTAPEDTAPYFCAGKDLAVSTEVMPMWPGSNEPAAEGPVREKGLYVAGADAFHSTVRASHGAGGSDR